MILASNVGAKTILALFEIEDNITLSKKGEIILPSSDIPFSRRQKS